MKNEKPRACYSCGATDAIAVLVDASVLRGGIIPSVIDNLQHAVKCQSDYDCVRRREMNLGPRGRGWVGPRIV